MPELVEKLSQLFVQKLNAKPTVKAAQLASELESEIEAEPQFAGLLRTNHLMIQIAEGNTQAFQTVVNGGVVYIGTHYHLDPEQCRDIFSDVLTELIPKIVTNPRSIFLDHQPPSTDDFQGRQKELEQLQQWLKDKSIRLVGITSAGGYGKSTLAAKLYQELAVFEQKIWITFDQPRSFKEFSIGLLEKLGHRVDEKTSDQEVSNALIEQLSNHRFLLVLDNLESLLKPDRQFQESGYQDFLLNWLEKQNASTILFTSRERPKALEQPRNNSQWLPLRGLTVDAGIQLLKNQRWENRSIDGGLLDFQKLIQVADGHPLLLRLAASWLHDQPTDPDVKHILNQHDLDHLTALIGSHRGNSEVSIGKLLAESIKRLPPGLKTLWLNLSVYRYRPIDLAVAQAVASNPITAKDLRELAKRSLLEEHKSQGQWRYRFLKLLKDFAQHQFSQYQVDSQRDVRQKAIEYCRSVAKPSGWTDNEIGMVIVYHQFTKPPNWKNQEDIAEYLEIFHHCYELDQFASAFHLLWSTGCDAFLEFRGYNSIRVELYITLKPRWAARLSGADPERILFAAMLDCLGTAYRALGQYLLAIESHQEALEQFHKIRNRDYKKEATCRRNLGTVYQQQGAYQQAIDCFEQAHEISQRINDALGELLSLQGLIDTNSACGEHQKNIALYQRQIALFRQYGDRLGEAAMWNALGSTYRKIGQYQDAVTAHQQALTIFQTLADREGQAQSWQGLGDAYKELGNHEEALHAHQQALQMIDNRLEQALSRCRVGWDLLSSGQPESAIEIYEQALTIFREVGSREGEAQAFNGLGVANQNLGHHAQAISYYEKALEIHRQLHDLAGEAVVLNNLGVVHEHQGDAFRLLTRLVKSHDNTCSDLSSQLPWLEQYQQAFEFYRQSLEIGSGVPDRDLGNEAKTRHNLGRVGNLLGESYYTRGQYQQTAQSYHQALNAFEGINDNFRNQTTEEGEAKALLGLGNARQLLGHYSDALKLHQRTLEVSRKLGDRPGEAEALLGLGNAYYSLGNYRKPNDKNAIEVYEKASIIFQELGDQLGEAKVKLGLGKTYHALGDCQRALELLGKGGA